MLHVVIRLMSPGLDALRWLRIVEEIRRQLAKCGIEKDNQLLRTKERSSQKV
jgi:aryl carrier-like protein